MGVFLLWLVVNFRFLMFRFLKVFGIAILLAAASLCSGAEQGVLLYAPSVNVSRFEAVSLSDSGLVQIQWQTTVELGVDGFRVLRQRNGGKLEPVGSGFVRSKGDEDGGTYELADPLVQVGETVHYELVMISRHGMDQKVADWTGVVAVATARKTPDAPIAAAAAPLEPSVLAQSWIGSGDRVLSWINAVPADRVRLSVRDQGVYRVSAQELADASGWGLATVSNAMSSTNLSLSCLGASVSWFTEGTNLFFYGLPTESRFAPENVYWISLGAGSNMVTQVMTPGEPSTTNDWFINQISRQGTGYLSRVLYSSLADAPAPFVSFTGALANGKYTNFVETLTDCVPGLWMGVVTVHLMSYCETGTDDHTVSVSIGGKTIGNPTWSGEQYLSFSYPFASTNLTGSAVILSLTNIASAPPPAPDNTSFLLLSYGYSYPCSYRARIGALRCTGGDGNTVMATGFSSNDIVVLDVTMANHPCVVAPVTISYDSAASNWMAAFPCGGTGQIYQIFSKTSGVLQPAVRGVRDGDGSALSNAADYVILVPPEAWRPDFRAALQPLVDFRNAQGLRTLIMDVESLYNRYSYGVVDPLAIRAFCSEGYTNGVSHPLRYLLLAGSGALDFKHQRLSVNDYSACLIPPMIAGQRFLSGEGMTVALDGAFGDVNGDGVPEIAIGRLPTTKTQELGVVVQKTIAYEGALIWRQQASVCADWDNTGDMYYPFSAGTDRLIAPLTNANRSVVKHYPIDNTGNLSSVKFGSLFPALSVGSGLLHFFGHSNVLSLGGSGTESYRLLWITDITSANWQKPAIGIIIGCFPNRWQSFSTTVSLIPYGLFATNTGFVAGLGANGYMLADEGENLAVSLYSNAAAQGTVRLGDVWRQGLAGMAGIIPSERLLCYSLVGDPALVYRHDISAMSTPVSWLIKYGLTAPNADLADPDFDGWPTWQEYQSGTGPTNCDLRIPALNKRSPGRYALAFEADSNRQYSVEFKPSLLVTDDWQTLSWAWTNATEWIPPETPIVPQGPVTTVEVPISEVLTQGFYRIQSVN